MINAYRFNYDHMPAQIKMGSFDEERTLMFTNLLKLIEEQDIKTNEKWFPMDHVIQKFKDIYGLTIEEREKLINILLPKTTNSVTGLQNHFSLLSMIIQNKQNQLKLKMDWRQWDKFLNEKFITNQDKSITSQTLATNLFIEFCQFLRSINYFFEDDVIEFATKKFKQYIGYQDKQIAWSYVILFIPFRKDIPQSKYDEIITLINDPFIREKENCKLKFMNKYLMMYPNAQINLLPTIMRIAHSWWRMDLSSEEKNERLINMLPDDTMGVPSMMKIIPKLLIEQLGSSTRPGYQEYLSNFKQLFSLMDSITSVYNQQTWDVSIFKLIKLMVGNFIFKFRRDKLLIQILDINNLEKYDSEVSQQIVNELIEQYDADIEDFIKNEDNINQLINEHRSYNTYLINYPKQKVNKKENGTHKLNTSEIKNLLPYLMDEQVKKDFIDIILSIMDKILFMEDPGFSTAKTILYLTCFDPSLIGYFLEKLKKVMNETSSNTFVNFKNILIFLTIPILQAQNNFSVDHLKDFMSMTYQLFEIQGLTENIDSLEFYGKILLNIPVYDPKEYKDRFQCENETCNFLSDFMFDVFKIIIKELSLFKYKDSDTGPVLLNLTNLFWPMIANFSDIMLDKVVQLILNYIANDIDIQDMTALGDLLDCIMSRCPEKIFPSILASVNEHLLKPKSSKQKHYLDFLIEKSEYKDYILQFEPTNCNKQSKLLWLTLLEKSLTYISEYCQQYDKELQTIILLYISDDGDEVFTKVSDIIHSIIITNTLIKPKNLTWQNSNFFVKDFNKKKKFNIKDLEVQWWLPNQSTWTFINKWLKVYLFDVIEHLQETYIKDNQEFKVPQDFNIMIDHMIFGNPTLDPKLKQIFFRLIFLIFGSFTGVSIFSPFYDSTQQFNPNINELTQFQQNYFKKLIPWEIFELRQKLSSILIQIISYAIAKGLAYDKDINELLITIGQEVVGSTILNQEIQIGREYLEGCRQLNLTSQSKLYFDSRLQEITDINTYLYQRHQFLYDLQSAPQFYNKIQYFAIVLFLLNHAESINHQYLLPYSEEITQTLSTDIREKFFEYLLKVLDFRNPNSRLCQINQCTDRSKEYKQLQDLLSGFNSAVQHIPVDIKLSLNIQQQLNQFITILDNIENQICKNLITESCVHQLAIQYDENNSTDQNDNEARIQMINYSTQNIQSQVSWKCKIIHSLSVLNNINICKFIPESLIPCFAQLSICDHVALNQLGRAALFYFLRLAKQKIYIKENIYPQSTEKNLPFNEFLQYRYVTQEQLNLVQQSYERLNNSYDILDYYNEIFRLKNHEKYQYERNFMVKIKIQNQNDPFIKQLRQLFTDQTFLSEFLQKILIDKDVQPSTEFEIGENDSSAHEVQFMSVQSITKYVQIFFSYIYGKNKVRNSPFSSTQSFFMSDFYFRLFKKIFQVVGITAFNQSQQIIEQYSDEMENREKQRLVCCYLTGLQRSLLNCNQYVSKLFCKVLNGITQEIFYDYNLGFFYMCRDQDWQWLSPIFDIMIEKCKIFEQQAGLKGLRYISLIKIFISSQGTRAVNLQKQCFKGFWSILPNATSKTWPSSNYLEEYVSVIIAIILQSMLVPLPANQFIGLTNVSSLFDLHYNQDLIDFFINLNQLLDEHQNVKNAQELAQKLLEHILIYKFDKISVQFITKPLQIVLSNNSEEINTQDILRRFIESKYEDEDVILELVYQLSSHENWIVRKRCNWFLRDWNFKRRLEGSITDISVPYQLRRNFLDTNLQIQIEAILTVADYLKLFDTQQLQILFNQQQENRVQVLMAMLLSRMDRNYEWTSQALQEVLSIKNKKLIQEFVGLYWKSREDEQNIFNINIQSELKQQLKEIVNPYVYFA